MPASYASNELSFGHKKYMIPVRFTYSYENWYATGTQIILYSYRSCGSALRLTAAACPQQNQSAYAIFIEWNEVAITITAMWQVT